VEILALRHQIAVLERQLGQRRMHFTAADLALWAALLHLRVPKIPSVQVMRRVGYSWSMPLSRSRRRMSSWSSRPGSVSGSGAGRRGALFRVR
jgi:hypothetical protein